MSALKHINRYFLRYRWRLLLGVLFTGISNIFSVYSVVYVRDAVDFLNDPKHLHLTVDENLNGLIKLALTIVLLAVISGFFLFLMRQTIIVMSRLIEYDLKNEIYTHYQRLDVSFYKRNNTGDLMNRISEDVSRVRMYIGPAIMYIVNTTITFLLTIFVMIDVNPLLTLYVLLPLPLLAISIYYVSNTINKKSNSVQQQLSGITTKAQEAFSGIRILKAYGRERYAVEDFEAEANEYRNRNLKLVKTESLFQPFMILLIGLSTIFTIYIGGKMVIDKQITDGNIAEFIVYINRLTWPIASLGWVTSLIQRASASQARINEFLHTQPAVNSGTITAGAIHGNIEFKNVSFVYPDSGIQALNNVSFHLKKGTSLAIVGHTGSGKSTIANLITRLYDPSSGEIRLDGIALKDYHLSSLRDSIGYVPQEVFLFSDSIAHNIAFSIDPQQQLQQEIETAAKNAAIYSNIMQFPAQFETVVGERGITLSGGQKQRISIARALIKNPKILLFDDCLSAVDTETEEEILNNLKTVMKGKTTVIISHRISSVKHADQILVLENGSIVESGNHQGLLTFGGIYSSLYKLQLLDEEKKHA